LGAPGLPGETGPQGPMGPSGTGTNTSTISQIAGIDISGGIAVIMVDGVVYPASNTTLSHSSKVIGVTVGAVIQGASVNVQTSGVLNGFSGLTSDLPVYLSSTGQLSTTLPTSGFILQMGTTIASDTVVINLNSPIVLG